MKIKKTLIALLLTTLLLSFSACGIGEAISNNIESIAPDPSLVADCVPDTQENIAVVPRGLQSTFITQRGITDVNAILKNELQSDISSLKLSYQKDGAYALFYLTQAKKFYIAKISYSDDSVQILFTREGECPTVLGQSTSHFIIQDLLESALKITFINKSDYLTKSVEIQKYSSVEFLAIAGDNYLISTTHLQEESTIFGYHVLNVESGITATLQKQEKHTLKYSAGESLQAVLCGEDSCIILNQGASGYAFEEQEGEIKSDILSAENLTCYADYLILGYPNSQSATVYAPLLQSYLPAEQASIIKALASGKGSEKLFVTTYNKYDQTLTFSELNSQTSVTIDIYNSAEGVVPTALKKTAIASEGREGKGIYDVQTFENNQKLYFTCYYFDSNGNKIYCIYTFDFQTEKIGYIGVASSPSSLLGLVPNDDGIDLIFYN